MQRLLGYLATTIPNLEAHVQDFAAAAAASPASSASSAASPAMTADAFQQTYESTRIPEILDAILPPLVSARDAAKLKLDHQQHHLLPNPPPSLPPTLTYPTSLLAKGEQQQYDEPNSSLSYAAAAGDADRDAIMTSLDPYQPVFASTSNNGPSSIPFVALHALANVAVPDHNKYHHHHNDYHDSSAASGSGITKVVASDGQEGAVATTTTTTGAVARPLHAAAAARATSEKGKGKAVGGENSAAEAIDPALDQRHQQANAARSVDTKEEEEVGVFIPDGATRSALLDLYFNQVVQPSFPMLVRRSTKLQSFSSLPFVFFVFR